MVINIIRGFIISLIMMQPVFANEHAIIGSWINAKGDGIIEITLAQTKYIGTIIGTPDPIHNGRKDSKNPDQKLRDRLLEGLTILEGFSYQEENLWSGGTIYDPNSGKTYKCKLSLNDDGRLKVRGYIGVSLFGRTEVWKRQE
ncbi:MAG: hypothetical protein ACI85N_001429 [Gammaproteobacteria bacterium]|jgi:uncharacterized protein (DUF2147 family)